jgi:hypothetical protein
VLVQGAISDREMREQTAAYVQAVLHAHPELNPFVEVDLEVDPYPVRHVRPLLPRCGIKRITQFICKRTGYTPEEMRGLSQEPNLVRARWECFFIATKKGYSIHEIGREYNRDPSTVRYGLEKMGLRRK